MLRAVDGRPEASAAADATYYGRSIGRSTWKVLAAAGLLMAAGLVGGCASQPALVVKDAAEFDQTINRSDQPVLMMFFKQGCATCAALEPTIDQLAGEYKGRAVVAKFMIYNFVLMPTSQEIKDRYEISFVPDVILFVHGQQRQRWFSDYNINNYRKALNEVVSPATAPAKNGKIGHVKPK